MIIKRILLSVDEPLHKSLKNKAKQNRRTMQTEIRMALENHLKNGAFKWLWALAGFGIGLLTRFLF